MDSQKKKSGQLLQPTLGLVQGLMSVLIMAALSFMTHFAEKWKSVGKREDCVVGDNSSEDDNMPSPTRQYRRPRSSSTVTRTPVARQRHCLRRIQQRRTSSSHVICCPTEEEKGDRNRYSHMIFPQTLDKEAVIADCDPKESCQENLCASDIQTSSRHRSHIPAGFTNTPSHAEEQIEDIEPDGTSHLEGLKSDATTKEGCGLPPKKFIDMKAGHKYTQDTDAEGALHRNVTDISLHHSKPDISQDEIDHSLWKVILGISVCQSDPASEAPSFQNSTRDRASVSYTDLENGAVSEGHECVEGQSSKDGGEQQTQSGNFEGGCQDKGQSCQCRNKATGGLRGSASGGDGGGDDDDDRDRKDEKRSMDECLHLTNHRKKKKKKKKSKKAARAVKEGVTEMTSDGAETLHVLSGPVSNTAARSSSKGHGWMVNQVSDGDNAVHHTDVPPPQPPLPPPRPPSACGNGHKSSQSQSEAIPFETTESSSSSFTAGHKSNSQRVNDFETQLLGHGQPQPIAAEDMVTQPFHSDQWQTKVCCSQPPHETGLFKHPQQCEEDLQREQNLDSCCPQPISTQSEQVQLSLLEDALAAQTSTGQLAELKKVSGLHDIFPVEVQLKRPQQCVEDLTLNAAAISSRGHHSDGHTVNHDTGPQQAQSRKAVRSPITIRPNVVVVEKSSHDALLELSGQVVRKLASQKEIPLPEVLDQQL
ncbi:hypothetical protein C0Q70_10868 [Pomacea canaliculata]|uniref:Uncharacterized protein n=1 Tax=Pomacea canaliculata TaxID=400727 RepID=A0A2T7P4E6_POMCA|nr:hypothetical protein C0Q70_10868 [Pomacea canaliculata]